MIQVAGLTSPDPLVTVFVIHAYSDSGLTNLVDVQSAHAVKDTSTGGTKMVGYANFSGLQSGVTYYLVAGTVTTRNGSVNWSSPVAVTDTTASAAAPLVSPMNTQGDIIVGGASGTAQRLAAGPAGYVLTSNGPGASLSYQSAPGFTYGNNANGYWVKDPTGHIRQWGKVASDINGGTYVVSFPRSFTNLSSVSLSVTTVSSTDRITFIVDGSPSLTGFTVSDNGSGDFAHWQADGY